MSLSKSRKNEKSICPKCDEECKSKSDGLPCAGCEFWYHTKCINGMTNEFVENHDRLMHLNGGSSFICRVCCKIFSKFNGSFQEVFAKMTEIEKNADHSELEKAAMKEKIERLEAQLDQVRARIVVMEKDMEAGMQQAVKEVKEVVAAEMKQVEDKSSNIVLYGVPEPEGSNATERRESDEEEVRKVAEAIGVEVTGGISAKYRAGRFVEGAAKPRPMIVTIEDAEIRAKMLKNAPRLAQISDWKGVFIWEDLTKQQREESKKREDELRENARRMNEEAKNEGKTGGSYKVVGRGERRRVVWWWESRGAEAQRMARV